MNTSRLPPVVLDDFEREINQEDFLVELAERLQLEMDKVGLDLDPEHLETDDDYFVYGVLEALENPTMRQVADLFHRFGKVLSLVPHERHERAVAVPVEDVHAKVSVRSELASLYECMHVQAIPAPGSSAPFRHFQVDLNSEGPRVVSRWDVPLLDSLTSRSVFQAKFSETADLSGVS